MSTYLTRLCTVAFVVGFSHFACVSRADAGNNWPNWRGPNHNGSLADADPPTNWSGTENVKWKVPLPGKASGTPIVWGDQVILLTAVDTGKQSAAVETEERQAESAERPRRDTPNRRRGFGRRGGFGRGGRAPTTEHEFVVVSLNLSDGKEQWRSTVHRAVPHESGHQTNSFASASAVTDGKHIFAFFGSNGLYCLDMQGELVWSKSFGKMQTRNGFGEGGSPALVDNTLIVPWDHEGQSAVYALDAETGELRWETDRDEATTWSTPLIVEHGGKTQVIVHGRTVRSYDLATGSLLWSCGGQVSNPIPCPVRVDDAVVCMTGHRGNAIYALPLTAKGDISDSDQVLWHRTDAAPYVASPTLYKGQLYFTKERSGVMSSVDARTGEVLIPPTRLSQMRDVYASPVAAGDKIYFTGREGVTVVVQHGSELKELAINDLGEPVDSSPVIIGDALLIRGAEHLYYIAG